MAIPVQRPQKLQCHKMPKINTRLRFPEIHIGFFLSSDNNHIYVVTQSLARSETALEDLAELLEAANYSSNVQNTVLPIFYGVEPSDVRHQTASFAQAFANYEKKYKDDPQKVERWRAALRKLANLAGWDSKHYIITFFFSLICHLLIFS
ncbi:putative TIR domain-containing protein [Rosa chinensis]|uniref:Putative TIR domain-containing protein n=1 Tax=Rosa chinensis TaxID=74649 RepID=A0A2P6QBA9_ROSCH|nr:putative TIR domain-containing protein [Rosa chinensis]